MPFHDIAGNGRAKAILRMALSRDRVPNSLLFVGPRGVGKRRTARVLAQALNCLNMKDDACGECGPCRAIEVRNKKDRRGTFPDVIEIQIGMETVSKENKTKPEDPEKTGEGQDERKDLKKEKTVISMNQIQELRQMAYLRPMIGRRRVFIIEDADNMSEEAENALLKVLEEPPLFTHIILLAENSDLILATIKSRCHTLTFLPVSDEEIEKALLESGVPADRARIIAIVCRGNLEKALEMDWDEIQKERGDAWRIFSSMADGSDPAALPRLYGRKRQGEKRGAVKDELAALLELLSTFGRDALLLGEGGDPGLLINPDFETELRNAVSQIGPGRALQLIGLLHGAAASLDRNGNFGALTTSLTAQWLRADEAR